MASMQWKRNRVILMNAAFYRSQLANSITCHELHGTIAVPIDTCQMQMVLDLLYDTSIDARRQSYRESKQSYRIYTKLVSSLRNT